ncbi:glutamate racemase [Hydrogenispora ethanolica]|uniref:Glutamate racemase n=1 Tax=Hydrogenispora ethanolica TaxID=1082276 RepID=A0A4R1RYT7_HYDET|nr:glutamate racemase [Hydrogenispora ethanolica]TCL71684.1 glutamate racemase [Hydrogenispora ethanolica]
MSSSAPIGVFDSGVGGLSILREIRTLLPHEDLIYLADSGHCPYGTKPPEEIRRRTLEVSRVLAAEGVKAIVVACNAACTAGLEAIRAAHPGLPVVGVEPALKPAHGRSRNGRIGVLATQLTLRGSRFSGLMERYGDGVQVFTQAAPGLVELVESGQTATSAAETMLRSYLEPLLEQGIDTLVLGCTHYPFLRPLIQKLAGPELLVLDTGAAVARQTERVLTERGLMNEDKAPGRDRFYTSGDLRQVAPVIRQLWGDPQLAVLQVPES